MVKKVFDKKLLFAMWASQNKNYGINQIYDSSLKRLFKNIIFFDPQELIYKKSKEEMNKRFLELVKKEKPDFILLYLIYEEFYLETLASIKKINPKIKIINFCGEENKLFENTSMPRFSFIDYFFIIQQEYVKSYKKYNKKAFVTYGADPVKFKPSPNTVKTQDVTFIGTPIVDRVDYVRYLLKKGINIKVYGSGWEEYSDLKDIWGGKVSNDEYKKIIRTSKINLCFSKQYGGKTHVLERVPQFVLSKAFFLVESCPQYNLIFSEGKDFVSFKDKQDLFNKINYYLNNEKLRNLIISRAYKNSLRKLSIDKLLEKAFIKIDKDNSYLNSCPDFKNNNVFILKEKDLKLDKKILRNKIGTFKYISFKEKGDEFLNYNNFLQIRGIELTKKPIACCNWYMYSKSLRDYASVSGFLSFWLLSRTKFLKLLNPCQLVVKRDYFLKNLKSFKSFKKMKTKLIKKENVVFISYPLVRVSRIRNPDYSYFKKAIITPHFDNTLRALAFQKKLFTNFYLYNLIIVGILGNLFLLKYLFKRAYIKSNFLRSYLVLDNKSYN